MYRNKHLPLKVIYTGAIPDLSGYAVACRENIRALDSVGVDIAIDARSFEPWKPQDIVDSVLGRRLYTLMGREKSALIQILHLTPDLYHEYKDIKRYKVGYFAWETSRLPGKWVKEINNYVDEVWVPCQYLAEVARNSGVTKNTFVFPHPITLPSLDTESVVDFGGFSDDAFVFYSIFQWSARKCPEKLLEAYYKEFKPTEKVCLLLKTYRKDSSVQERNKIRLEISKSRRTFAGSKGAPVALIESFLCPQEMIGLHQKGDCYVTMTRAEGYGLGAYEAASFGKPIIVPAYSSFPEHFNEGNSYLVDVPNEVPVSGMGYISPLYKSDMYWGDPSVDSLRKRMREVFEDRETARAKGFLARQLVQEKLSYETIGNAMKGRIEQILGKLSERTT